MKNTHAIKASADACHVNGVAAVFLCSQCFSVRKQTDFIRCELGWEEHSVTSQHISRCTQSGLFACIFHTTWIPTCLEKHLIYFLNIFQNIQRKGQKIHLLKCIYLNIFSANIFFWPFLCIFLKHLKNVLLSLIYFSPRKYKWHMWRKTVYNTVCVNT